MRNSISYYLTVSYLSFQGGLSGGTCLVFQSCSLAAELPQGSARVYGRWAMFLCGVGEGGESYGLAVTVPRVVLWILEEFG